ncbi:MAG: mandelate racemase/muconate lactonizing enzyme family protein [bacterium]|nr:mandelate racemase/muconate lactonizing enzyme family protein [bacterium]
MRVADVETFVVANPPPSFGGRYFAFVKLTTDDGIVGYGEHYGATFRPAVVESMLHDVAGALLLGEDPFLIERFFRRAYGRGFTARPDVSMAGVISALEMACWDIIGKALDKPVHALLGGQLRDAVRSYTYLYEEPDDLSDVYLDPDLAARRAFEYVERGFTAVKFDPAGPYASMGGYQPLLERIELSARFCEAIREAVGTRADLLFGTHGQFTPAGAIRLARRLEPFDPLWFEEPVPPDDVAGMAHVRSHTTIPIAAGERLATKVEFARLMTASAVDILQPDLGRCGGILEGKKIASIAEVHGAQIAPHCYSGPIVGAANLQLAACTPNFLILEAMQDWGGFHAELLKTPLRFEDGHTLVPPGPGLGVELDEEVARRHAFEGEGLHLEMEDDPVDYRDPRWAGSQG